VAESVQVRPGMLSFAGCRVVATAARYVTTTAGSAAANGGHSASYPVRSVCKAVIVGRTGSRPREFTFPNGDRALTFSVATNEIRVRDGEREDVRCYGLSTSSEVASRKSHILCVVVTIYLTPSYVLMRFFALRFMLRLSADSMEQGSGV
jgi:hypothetical protein